MYYQRMQQTLDTTSTDRTIQLQSQLLCKPKRASNLFSWLEWTITDNNSLSFCEKTLGYKIFQVRARLFKDNWQICRTVNSKSGNNDSKRVARFIWLVLDGWTHGQTHYVGLFAVYPYPANPEQAAAPLLSFSPLLIEQDFTASSYYDFIKTNLETVYLCKIDKINFSVADNCAMNKSLSDLLGVPLFGCASHRLIIAVKNYWKLKAVKTLKTKCEN